MPLVAIRKVARLLLGFGLVLSGITCVDTATSPGRYSAMVAVNPTYSNAVREIAGRLSNLAISIDNVRIRIDHSDGAIAVDTVIVVPPAADSVVLEVNVELNGSTEMLKAEVSLRSGTTVLFSGERNITAKTGAIPQGPPADIAMTFTGPGADAATLVVSEGVAFCWGRNASGQLGNGSTEDQKSLVPVGGEKRFVRIAAGHNHTCAISTDGDAYCWGDNTFGQLGSGESGTETSKMAPELVKGGLKWASIQAGENFTCAVTNDAEKPETYCWGTNDVAQLGIGSTAGPMVEPHKVTLPGLPGT